MEIRKAFLVKVLNSTNMLRWNDKIRPVELRELDKQAHKMIIAYFLGKFETKRPGFDWAEIIEGGIFEFLQRIEITDLKPQIFHEIEKDKVKYKELNSWVWNQLKPAMGSLGRDFCDRFKRYFSSKKDDINKRILRAAHFYATKWEFDIIDRANPYRYEIDKIRDKLRKEQEENYDLEGISRLAMYDRYKNFIDLCGQLRFQIRWGQIHRNPKTSVLGHMLIVAMLSYLFSVKIRACKRRSVNNYFTGLFHDLPEVLTKDIISPVKASVSGLDKLIKKYEKSQMNSEVYALIPPEWHDEVKMFTENEFKDFVTINARLQRTTTDKINTRFNKDVFNPRDGSIVYASDQLAAFVEAHQAVVNGAESEDLNMAKQSIKAKNSKNVGGIAFDQIYADFEA